MASSFAFTAATARKSSFVSSCRGNETPGPADKWILMHGRLLSCGDGPMFAKGLVSGRIDQWHDLLLVLTLVFLQWWKRHLGLSHTPDVRPCCCAPPPLAQSVKDIESASRRSRHPDKTSPAGIAQISGSQG